MMQVFYQQLLRKLKHPNTQRHPNTQYSLLLFEHVGEPLLLHPHVRKLGVNPPYAGRNRREIKIPHLVQGIAEMLDLCLSELPDA